MKKTILIIVMAMLCLVFNQSTPANAQVNKAIDVTTKGIQIGQKVPDILINHIHNYIGVNGKPATTAKLSDFNGKLLILDFWATWCSPCIAMMPKMEVLQEQFNGKLQIVKVSYQPEDVVLSFMQKLKTDGQSNIPEVTSDKELHNLFPHIYLPHYVWIDGEGVVKAITAYDELTEENIISMLGPTSNKILKQKSDSKIVYDKTKPLFLNGNGGEADIIHYSILTRYAEGLKGKYTLFEPDDINGSQKITCTNIPLQQLYSRALGGIYNTYFGANRLIFDVADTNRLTTSSKGNDYLNWLRNGNGFCYELVVPSHLKSEIFKMMYSDLQSQLIDYNVSLEKRKVKCLVLTRTSKLDKIKTKGGKPVATFSGLGCSIRNRSIGILMGQLDVIYLQKSKLPLVNGTDYTGRVDIDIHASLSDINAINHELEKYDLKFIESIQDTEMIVFRDNKK